MALPQTARVFDGALQLLMVALLAWLPFAFGGVLPSSHLALVLGAGAMAFLFGLRCLVAGAEVVRSWAYLPLGLFLLLVALQSMPGSAAWLAGLAPENARLWHDLLSTPPLLGEMPKAPLTLNPAATATDLRVLLALACVFVIAANVLRSRSALRRMLTAIAVIGASLAVVAVVQTLSGTTSLLWLFESPAGRATSGPFVHYGHFSQFVNLAIGAGLGLVLLRLAERDQRNQYAVEDLVRDLGAPDRRMDLFLFGFVIVGVVAICLSRSRNGVLSMVVAGAITALLLHRTRYLRGMGWSLGALAAMAFVVLLFVGFDPVYERMATLDDEAVFNFRLAIAADGLSAAAKFPWLGSGQGTFADVFPLFDTTSRPGRAEHAENQYVELLVETGVVGFLLIGAFAAAIGWPWLRRLRARRDAADGALFGLLFGVVAVLVHACSDFGLRIPAVAGLALVCLGAVVARTGRPWQGGVFARWLGALLSLCFAALLFAQVPAIAAEGIAYEHAEAARAVAARVNAAETVEEAVRLRQRERGLYATAIEAVPGRADLQVAYATAAWQSIVVAEGIEAAPVGSALPDAQIARLREAAALIQKALLEVRPLCPIRGDLWSMIGQLGTEWLDDAAAATFIERGFRFAPENPDTCAAWARALLRAGDPGAPAMFARAIEMGHSPAVLLGSIVQALRRFDMALAVARHNPRWQLWLVRRYQKDAEYGPQVAPARQELVAWLRAAVARPDALAWTFVGLAEFEAEDGHAAEAILLYRRYLALVPGSSVRLSLATLLKNGGDPESARQEVRRFLNYNPGHTGAKRMLADLGM